MKSSRLCRLRDVVEGILICCLSKERYPRGYVGCRIGSYIALIGIETNDVHSHADEDDEEE